MAFYPLKPTLSDSPKKELWIPFSPISLLLDGVASGMLQ